ETIAAACDEAGVVPRVVVAQFAEYYQGNRLRHGWADPVQALRRTIAIQIVKAQGRAPPSGNGRQSKTLHEKRMEMERATPKTGRKPATI
ncbi:MAG TPA: hypothetical protein VJ417_06555, partial [Candidatus Glassbacteria bacterium]|nr:hypothetical protein [Candidatus Glassbacteria bacterium]